MIVEFMALLAIALFCFYKWATANYNYFDGRHIPYDKPFPLFGNMSKVLFKKRSLFDTVIDLYEKFDSKIYGVFDNRTPILALKDPEVIRQVTVKEFDHFVNHRSIVADEEGAGLFGKSLFLMKDQRWKDMRATLSPAFTGSKMRVMFQLITEVSYAAVEYLKKDKNLKPTGMDVDMKEFFTRVTNDVIATTAFGIKVNSLKDRDNEFYTIGKTITRFTVWQNFKFFLFMNFKWVAKVLKLQLFDEQLMNYFMRLVLDAMKYREENKIVRPDMINMLMEAKGINVDGSKKDEQSTVNQSQWSDEDLVGQCFLFFFAGFETASVLMCMAAHELMENPETQQKLQAEIEEVKESLNGKPLTYEALQGMKYLDAVVSETLRKWPPAPAVDRVCSKNFTIKDGDLEVDVKAGDILWLPIAGIQRDPKYWENPLVFDPERFNDENKANIKPFTYIPFGVGPRNCIGSRFALLEAKAMLFCLASEFNFEAAEKSVIPMELSPAGGFQITTKNGFWLKMVPRTN